MGPRRKRVRMRERLSSAGGRRLFREGYMDSRFKMLGHAVHPMLIAFPLGLLATSVVFDIVTKVTHDQGFALVAYWLIAAGIVGGLLAAVPGLVDWLAIPAGTRAKRVGLLHACSNVGALLLFALSWLIRRTIPAYVPDTTAFMLSVGGFAMAGLGGWLGGELVERLGVAVHDGAHLDAPNSLTGTATRTNRSR